MISQAQVARAEELFSQLREALARVVVGHQEVMEVVLWGLLCGGHVLLEGVPGLGKTLIVRTLAHALGLSFSRIQFTPDLMPADILGTNVFSEGEGFRFLPGPIFAHIVLADEINRATPKTQSALLEAMQERQVTAGGATHPLEEPFLVLATQNPIEMEGTYPLPEAQLDRFLFKAEVNYPGEEELVEIIRRNTRREGLVLPQAVMGREEVLLAREVVSAYPVPEPLLTYAARLVLATHPGPGAPQIVRRYVKYGASPRGALALVQGAKAHAFLSGRHSVEPEDVQRVAYPALVHRLILNFQAEAEGITPHQVLAQVLREVRVP